MKRLFNKNKSKLRQVRHVRVRKILIGTAQEPRLSVFRSLKGMVAQLVDDSAGKTLCYADAKEVDERKGRVSKVEDKSRKVAVSYLLGKLLAEKAKAKGISKVKFDRGGYRYHGRVKALADGAREGGLVF
jgi:large subunit ribosomal protein L18